MNRSELSEFLSDPQKHGSFVKKIENETDEYRLCLRKAGSSCQIVLCEDVHYEIRMLALSNVVAFLEGQPSHVRDYVLNGILLDPLAERDDEVNDLLEELTAPEG
jgi:hypothetical protein